MDAFELLVAATLAAGTPVALAALGLLINEKAGVVNLGAEGIMMIAAVVGFAVAFHSGSAWLALAAGAGVGAAVALLLGAMVIGLNTNQYASGLAISIFGVGFSSFAGIGYVGKSLALGAPPPLPLLGELPLAGPALFRQHGAVYATVAFAVAVWWFFQRTRAGLVVRGVGESPESAHALGYPVRAIRLGALAAGGAACGVAGAYVSVVYTPLWVEGMVAGRGWIALALTTFATWRPGRALAGAYLFGGVTMLQFHLQASGVQVASQLLSMLPYLATIVVLVLISRNPTWIRANMPAALGKPFHPDR
jgi:general nucleoside transport system permease protein